MQGPPRQWSQESICISFYVVYVLSKRIRSPKIRAGPREARTRVHQMLHERPFPRTGPALMQVSSLCRSLPKRGANGRGEEKHPSGRTIREKTGFLARGVVGESTKYHSLRSQVCGHRDRGKRDIYSPFVLPKSPKMTARTQGDAIKRAQTSAK